MPSRLPTEVWYHILEGAVAVPLFFEANPADVYGIHQLSNYYYELPYWKSERIRNSLRRVCKVWDKILQPLNHRFVRLADIYHKRIPKEAVASAIRLDIEPDWGCNCAILCKKRKKGPHSSKQATLQGDMVRLLRSLVELSQKRIEMKEWKLEILHGQLSAELEDFEMLKRISPRLQCILGWGYADYTSLNELSSSLQTYLPTVAGSLVHLSVTNPFRFKA